MLIQLSVANFRSFRNKQVFSMVAASRAGKKNNTFVPIVDGERFPALLKVAAIYGPNASGKSSLVAAFEAIHDCTKSNADKTLPFKPFRFDPDLIGRPSEIEVDFIVAKKRYTFYLAATDERIYSEHLHTYKKGKQISLYKRDFIDGKEKYETTNLEGGEVVHNAWKKLTSPRTLFIRQACLNSSEELDQLSAPFEWMSSRLAATCNHHMEGWAEASKSIGIRDKDYATDISLFLREIDVPVESISFEMKGKNKDTYTTEKPSTDEYDQIKTTLVHKTALGEASFDFSEESDGTKNLMGFWLPYSLMGEKGVISSLVIDELDSSLHPSIVEMLVKQHINKSDSSQLIFTTHDTHLMNSDILRRDQIWLTERDRFGATRLTSVHEFEGREGENIEKRYFEGRYRSLPILSSN